MTTEFIKTFVINLQVENIVLVMTHCDQQQPTPQLIDDKLLSYEKEGIKIVRENVVQFDNTP